MNYFHRVARWLLAHPKWVAILAVLGFMAFCGWKAWAAFQPNYGWAEGNADKFVIEDRTNRVSLMLAGLLAWIYLGTVVVRGKLGSMKWSGMGAVSFDARVRERVLHGVPIRSGVLLAYTVFGLVGVGFSLALMGQASSTPLRIGTPRRTRSRTRASKLTAPIPDHFIEPSFPRTTTVPR